MADDKPRVDHLAIAFENLDWAVEALTRMGFSKKWHRDRIGDATTAMKTTVMEWGGVSFAMMEGIDGSIPSQITEYTKRYGGGILQHVAIEVADLRQTVAELESKGFKFLTPILLAEDERGKLIQTFTYPLCPGGKFFFELNQRIRLEEGETIATTFADQNVEGLWQHVAKAIQEGWLFKVNIFGETPGG
jgi:4-hydroxyphenylpyruvate dioxygenase-like putative hemolysin